MLSLSQKELERYGRQILIFGERGQEKLKNTKVAILGLGGLGSAIAYYLVAAGVGHTKSRDQNRSYTWKNNKRKRLKASR